MSTVYRPNRKATDHDIIRMNSVGLSLQTIARIIGCHPTTVTLRLKSLQIPPADTRRTFMEDIFKSLTPDHQEWLADRLGPTESIKWYVRDLLVEEFKQHGHNQTSNRLVRQGTPQPNQATVPVADGSALRGDLGDAGADGS
ncbi:putative helix-turn-helix domain protein [Burkholderia phage vB_BpP_HN05]